MHEAVKRLKSFAECEEYARLMQFRDPALAIQARQRAIQLRPLCHL